jgi:hypothetical protein
MSDCFVLRLILCHPGLEFVRLQDKLTRDLTFTIGESYIRLCVVPAFKVRSLQPCRVSSL